MNISFQSFVEETNLADAWVMGAQFDKADIEKLKNKSGVNNVQKRMFLPATLDNDKSKAIDLYILDKENSISKMKVTQGKDYNQDIDGIWLDTAFAKANDYRLNDKFTLNIEGQLVKKEIVGLCSSSEYIYNTTGDELVPNHENAGFAFVSGQELKAINSSQIVWNQLLISGSGDVEKAVKDIVGEKGITIIMQKDHPSYSMVTDEITQHKEIGLMFATVFLFIAILITVTTVHRLLNSQRMQIGILKALGFRKKQLYIHYASHSVIVCLLGSFAGWGLGYVILPELIYPFMEEMYTMPELKPSMISGSWLLPIVCALFCLLITFFICKKYMKNNASKILYSNIAEKVYKDLPFSFLFKKLSFYGQWNVRDIVCNRIRSFMTVFGVVGCVALLFSSVGLYTSMKHMSEWTFDKVQTFETKVTGDFTDENYKNELLQEMYGEEFMEAFIEIKFKDRKKNASFTGIESQEYLRLYDVKNQEIELDEGIAVSRNIAKEMNLEIGDRLKWRFAGQEQWYLGSVKQIIHTPMSQGITMLRREMEKKNIPFNTTSIIGEKPEHIKLDSNYNTSIQHKADLKSGLDTMLRASIMLSSLFLIMAVLLGGVILYNLGAISYMERYREMATLKVLGFHDTRIRRLMIQQNSWLTVLGIVIGVPAGYGLNIAMLSTIQTSIDMSVYAPFYVYAGSVGGTFMLSWIISKGVSKMVCHIDMVSALKINE